MDKEVCFECFEEESLLSADLSRYSAIVTSPRMLSVFREKLKGSSLRLYAKGPATRDFVLDAASAKADGVLCCADLKPDWLSIQNSFIAALSAARTEGIKCFFLIDGQDKKTAGAVRLALSMNPDLVFSGGLQTGTGIYGLCEEQNTGDYAGSIVCARREFPAQLQLRTFSAECNAEAVRQACKDLDPDKSLNETLKDAASPLITALTALDAGLVYSGNEVVSVLIPHVSRSVFAAGEHGVNGALCVKKRRVRVAFGGCAPFTVYCPNTSEALSSIRFGFETYISASKHLLSEISPVTDEKGTAEEKTAAACALLGKLFEN